jgi:hypothetical protein
MSAQGDKHLTEISTVMSATSIKNPPMSTTVTKQNNAAMKSTTKIGISLGRNKARWRGGWSNWSWRSN